MAKTLKFIETPRGWVKYVKTANGKIEAELTWKNDYFRRQNENINTAQKFLDSEVLRYSNKYVPKVTSMLITSGILGTKPGSGEVAWIAPYAWRQYHLVNRKTTQNINPNGGPYWFERAMAVHLKQIKAGVAKKAWKD